METAKKQTIITVAMVLSIIILGIFVYVESSNQAKLIDLLDRCDYEEICRICTFERDYLKPALFNTSPINVEVV